MNDNTADLGGLAELDAEEARLRQLLDGVWQRRRQELLRRYADLGEAVVRLARARGRDTEAALAAVGEAHRLTGALGSLGFTDLARDAAWLEQTLSDVREHRPTDEELELAVRTTTRLGHELSTAEGRPTG